MENGLKQLAAMSNRYGADADYVLAGGGNTSYKDEDTLYIKPSGVSLAEIRPEDFVAMNRELLTEMLNAQYPPHLLWKNDGGGACARGKASQRGNAAAQFIPPIVSFYISIRRWSMV